MNKGTGKGVPAIDAGIGETVMCVYTLGEPYAIEREK